VLLTQMSGASEHYLESSERYFRSRAERWFVMFAREPSYPAWRLTAARQVRRTRTFCPDPPVFATTPAPQQPRRPTPV